MAAKGYSAGAIFLQVVPVFKNIHRDIEDEAKRIDRALGDRMEKSGEKAGERAGKAASKKISEEIEKGSKETSTIFEREFRKTTKEIDKLLGEVNIKRLPNALKEEFRQVRKEAEALSKIDVFDERALKRARLEVEQIQGGIQRLRDGSNLALKDNFDQVGKRLQRIADQQDRLKDPIELEVRPEKAERQMSAFEKSFKKTIQKAMSNLSGASGDEFDRIRSELKDLGDARIGVDISSNKAMAELARIKAEAKTLAANSIEIEAKVAALGLYAELAAMEAAVRRLDGREIRIKAKANTAAAERGLFGLKRSGDDAANTFRSFNIVALAVAGAGPALIPVLGAIAGGLLAIGPAAAVAAAGLGSVLVGFSGIGNALTALGNQQDQAAMTAQTAGRQQESAARGIASAQQAVADAERNAARAAETAARRVADARRSAAKAIESALDRQKRAQESYRDSVEGVRDAEKALREARKEAANTGAEIEQSIKANQLAIDQAMLDQFNTTVTYNATMSDGSATNAEKEQARINMERARLQMEELRAKQKELAKEKRRWDKQGVEGTKEVQTAQDRLNDALEDQENAYKGVQDAAKEVDEARAEGARRVSDAIRSQNETLADNARAIENAKEGLAQAKQASDDVAASFDAQQNAVNNAMDALSPAGQKFALFLFGLRSGFEKFRDDIQEAMLPSIQRAIEGFIGSSNAGTVRAALVDLAAGFGDFVEALSVSFQGEAWGAFFQMLADLGPEIQEAYGQAFILFLEALASILTVLAPYALQFAEGLRNLMDRFADWAASAEGAEGIQRFMDHMAEIGPDVLEFIGTFALAMTNVMIALAPYGEMILGLITALLDWIAQMDTEVLGNILIGILALITASQVAYGVMSLLLAGRVLLTSGLGLFLFLLTSLGLAIYYVYTQNKTLGIILGVVVGSIFAIIAAVKIWTGLMFIWRTITMNLAFAQLVLNSSLLSNPIAWIIVAVIALIAVFVLLWKNNKGFRDFFLDMWDKIKGALKKAWDVTKGVIDAIGRGFVWLWKNAIKPAMDGIWNGIKKTFTAIKDAWNNILWPTLKAIGEFIWNVWKVQFKVALVAILALFKIAFLGIKALWDKVLKPSLDSAINVARWLWQKAIKPAMEGIWNATKKAFTAIKDLWNNTLWPVLKFIGKVVWDLWKNFIQGALTLIADYFKAVFARIRDYWRDDLEPVFDAIGKGMKWLWKNAIKPFLDAVWRGFKKAFNGIKNLWNNILWPVLKAVGKVIWALWKKFIKTALTLIVDYFKAVFVRIRDFWRKILKPIFDAIGRGAKWLWEKGVKPAVDKIGDGWDKMSKGMKWAWDKVLKPVFDFMVDKALPKLKSAFKKASEAIERIWNGLKKIVGAPIKFVINTVIRDGLVKGFNKVAKWVGQDGFEFEGVDWKFATGGIMPGYTPGRDVHNFVSPTGGRLALSGGEAIMRPEWTAAMGPDYVNQMNALARQGGSEAIRRAMMGGQAYAKGGIFFPLPGARTGTYPGHDGVDLNVGSGWDDYGMAYYSATPGRVTSTGYGRGYGNAVFVASPYGELVYGHSSSVAVRAGQQVSPGQMLGRVGNTGNSTAPHLHFGFPNGSYSAAMALLSGALVGQPGKALGGGNRRSIPGWLMDIVKNPLKAVKGWVTGALGKAGEALDSPLGKSVKGIPGKLVKAATDKVWDVVPGWVKTAAGWAGDAADWVAGGAKKAGNLIKDGVKGAGNLVDKGLGAIGLADGGILPYNGTMKYDNGGYLPPGLTSVVNLTGKPEPVFTNDQWSNMENGAAGGNIHYEPHFEGSDLRAEDVAADLNFQFRKMRRGGKYEGVGSQ